MPPRNKQSNGQESTLAGIIRNRFRSGNVRIGSPLYTDGDEDDTANWAEVQKTIEGVKWQIPQWLPYGVMVGLIAQPKIGKSLFALGALVKPVITGCSWFGRYPNNSEPGTVVWVDTERRMAINMDRAVKGGLPLDRIKTPFAGDHKLKAIDLDDETHLDRIFSVVCRYKASLVIVDSFRGSHSGDENSSKIQSSLQKLGSIAEETNVSIAIIHHTKKLYEGEELNINCGRGSNAFLASVALQIVIDQPNSKSDWRQVQVLGENYGTAPDPIGFQISDTGLEFGDAPQKDKKITQKDKAQEWLQENMEPGKWYLASDILSDAKQFSHSDNAIQRAREELGITQSADTIRRRDDRKYEWQLPVPGDKDTGKTSHTETTN